MGHGPLHPLPGGAGPGRLGSATAAGTSQSAAARAGAKGRAEKAGRAPRHDGPGGRCRALEAVPSVAQRGLWDTRSVQLGFGRARLRLHLGGTGEEPRRRQVWGRPDEETAIMNSPYVCADACGNKGTLSLPITERGS